MSGLVVPPDAALALALAALGMAYIVLDWMRDLRRGSKPRPRTW